MCLDLELGSAEGRPVPNRQCRDEISFERSCAARVGAERGNELVRFDADIRSWKAKLPSDPFARHDRAGHRILTPQKPVRLLDIPPLNQAPRLIPAQLA